MQLAAFRERAEKVNLEDFRESEDLIICLRKRETDCRPFFVRTKLKNLLNIDLVRFRLPRPIKNWKNLLHFLVSDGRLMIWGPQ